MHAERAASAVGRRFLGHSLFGGLLRPDVDHRRPEADKQAAIEVEGTGAPDGRICTPGRRKQTATTNGTTPAGYGRGRPAHKGVGRSGPPCV